ncbi:unnamed protein product [Arabis nemorensis]|uniref:Afadin/alpha-actinin-binding protein n=1 Tax=Arabis nemorensis TaxID=586526 RepID=A0A565BEC6_9BRAS|nr:unnamed protein product [Arabis nemorensis]
MSLTVPGFDFRLTPQFGFSPIGDHSFADVDNLDHCVKYLNQSLVTYGFSASLDLFATDPVSIARTCNCIYALIQQRQRDVEFRESANDQRQRKNLATVFGFILLSDMARLEAKVERLETQLQAKERELGSVTRTEAKNTAALKAQNEKLQKERDEFQRMVIANQERLNQVLMEKKKETRSGMEIMNLLQKEGRQRGTWSGKKTDSDFYKKIVDAYEAKNQELMAENTDLRALLRSTQGDMRSFLNANGSHSADPSQSPLGGKTDVFDLPFRMARGQIEDSLRSKMVSIKERMGQLVDAQKEVTITSEATERELELEAQLVEARSIIQEQESIMSKHLPKTERRRNSAPPQSVNGFRG